MEAAGRGGAVVTVPKEDLEPGTLNAKHRYQYSRFSFGGDAPDSAYGKNYDATFGARPPQFCPDCGKRFSWCECSPYDRPGYEDERDWGDDE